MWWEIFWTPLQYDLKNIQVIIHACIRLHNFCVKRNMPIYTTSYEPPSSARVDEAGGLIDDIWRIPKAPKQRVRGSN